MEKEAIREALAQLAEAIEKVNTHLKDLEDIVTDEIKSSIGTSANLMKLTILVASLDERLTKLEEKHII